MTARALAASFAIALAIAGCGPKAIAPPPGPPAVALHLEPACDLAPAAGLAWVVDARPREIAEIADLIPAIALVVPEANFTTFAKAHGGIDLRQITGLCIARYPESSLIVARAPLDPARVESAFADRLTLPGGRRLDVPNPPVVRVWGEVGEQPQQLVIFGREAVALERGRGGAARVRVAEAFARGKLRRASPALGTAPLASVAKLLVADAPVRAFAPGPFEGDVAKGLGGLMRASTAVAASARYAGGPAKIDVRLVLAGAWGKDGPAAAERLAAAVHVVAETALGRLLGLDHPVAGPFARGEDDALVLDVTLDGNALARGLHDALDAEISDIMRSTPPPAVPRE